MRVSVGTRHATGLMDVRNCRRCLLGLLPQLQFGEGNRREAEAIRSVLCPLRRIWPEWEMLNNTDQGLVQYSSRRRFPRFEVNRPVTAILYWESAPPVLISGRCHSLSEGGLGATMSQQLRVGEVVNLEVAHGFEFVLVRDNQRAAIRRLCTSRLS